MTGDHISDPALVGVTRLNHELGARSFRHCLNVLGFVRDEGVRCVAVKINLCDYRLASSGATTDPVLLGALLDALRERFPNARLLVLENDASTLEVWSAFRLLGIEAVARERGAELHNLSEGRWRSRPIPGGRVLKDLEVPEILDACDLFISVPKLKTNGLTKITGSLKNTFALMRMKRKAVWHGRIDDVIHDMNLAIQPDLCLVEGFICQEGSRGPAFGIPKRCELLIAGRNAVAVDACCARIMGFRPSSVRHLRLCHKAGLGPLDYCLQTDIPDFDYAHYAFRFEYYDYWMRNLLRGRGGFAT